MTLKLVDRDVLLKQNRALAWSLFEWQTSTFDPDENPYEAGEEVYLELEDEKPTRIDAEMAQKLNDDFAEQCRSYCDDFETPPQKPAHSDTLIAELPLEPMDSYFNSMGKSVRALAEQIAEGRIHLITLSKAPYLYQDNDYPPVARATEQIMEWGVGKDYQGGIELQADAVEPMIENMFWIARCNASAPYICFGLDQSNVVGTLCKYGNIHFDCFDKDEQQQFEAALKGLGFLIPEDGMCEERFSDDGAMEGRRIDLS